MRIFISILILFCSLISFSQDPSLFYEDSIFASTSIQINSFNHYGSNKFNNALIDKFIFGGNIDQTLKDKNFNRLKFVNSLGGEFEQCIVSYSPGIHFMKKEKYGLVTSFSDNHFISGGISKDLFGLTFYGNVNYVGDSADISFAHFKYQHYQKLGFGFYDVEKGNSVVISYIIGSKGFDFNTGNSYLFTHSAVDSIELTLRGNGFSTNQFSPYLAFQGGGVSVDINYNFFFENKKGTRQLINLKINNIGGIFWNKNSSNFRVDSVSYYTGFDAKEFIGQDSINDTWNFEDTLGIIKSIGRHGEALPLEIVIQKLADYNGNKLQLIAGFKAIVTAEYRPYFYAGVFYKPFDKFSLNSYLSYGGFSNARLGLMLNYRFGKSGLISIGTVDLIGNISKQFGFGRSFVFSSNFNL